MVLKIEISRGNIITKMIYLTREVVTISHLFQFLFLKRCPKPCEMSYILIFCPTNTRPVNRSVWGRVGLNLMYLACANEQGMCGGVGVREESRKTASKSAKEREISEESAAEHLMNRSSTSMLRAN